MTELSTPLSTPLSTLQKKIVKALVALAAVVAAFCVNAPQAGAATTPVLGASNATLTINGTPSQLVGFNAYELSTYWSVNAGCGGQLSNTQMTSFFSALPAYSAVRFDLFEGGLAVNKYTGAIDWTGPDRVFAAAAAAHVFLIPVLANEWGGCDDNRFKDLTWYQTGYTQVPSASLAAQAGLPAPPLSYQDFVALAVQRYATSPALGMWEPVGEPEATTCPSNYLAGSCSGHTSCPSQSTAATALYNFFTTIGAEIRSYDPNHLIEAGFLGGGQCGTAGSNYQLVGASSGIDVLSYHDYYGGNSWLGGDQWNGEAVRIAQAAALHKPLIDAEQGILADANNPFNPSCVSLATRSSQTTAKVTTQFNAGVAAFLVWNFQPTGSTGCSYTVTQSDPLFAALLGMGSVPAYTG